MLKRGISVIVGVLTMTALAYADVSSDFSSDVDGWTNDAGDESTAWKALGGNPDGHIEFTDGFAAGYIVAPEKFQGNWSSMDGVARLMYDHKISATGQGINGFVPYEVRLSGPGGEAFWTGATPTGETGWVQVTAPLQSAEWTIVSGTWAAILADVRDLKIRIEMVDNSALGEVCGIDNVKLTESRTWRVCPNTMNIVFGTLVSGAIFDLCESDNRGITIRNGSTFLITQSPITVEFGGYSPAHNPTQLDIFAELKTSLPNMTARIDMLDIAANTWTQMAEGSTLTSDKLFRVTRTDAGTFVNVSDGKFGARVRVRDDVPAFLATWTGTIDHFVVDVTGSN